jgi:hypothetical protein
MAVMLRIELTAAQLTISSKLLRRAHIVAPGEQ